MIGFAAALLLFGLIFGVGVFAMPLAAEILTLAVISYALLAGGVALVGGLRVALGTSWSRVKEECADWLEGAFVSILCMGALILVALRWGIV